MTLGEHDADEHDHAPRSARCPSCSVTSRASPAPSATRAPASPSSRSPRPISIAALAGLSSSRPLIVTCPTGTMAGQLADDLRQFLPADEVVQFPGWETLPFERVSPSVETMGQRLEMLWRLRDPDRVPAVIVTGVRALLQKLGPGATTVEPVVVRPGAEIDPDQLSATLVEFGYRREELVEHRGEFARRGAIIDVYPSTADAPIRIDLWGDEVDRLTTFGVNDQRSIGDIDEVCIFPARELMPTDDVRERGGEARRERAVGPRAVGATRPRASTSTAWRAGCRGSSTTGRRRRTAAHRRPAADAAKLLLVEPRRMRDRAHRSDRRGGRPRPDAGVDVGPRSRSVVPAPARRPRHAAVRARTRSGRSTRHPSRPTPRSSRHRAGARSPATAPASPTG